MDKYKEELKQFRELCEEIKRVMPITDKEIELLDKAAMFWSVYEQIVWERDIAISQLEELGISLGEKVDHIKELINAEPQWIPCSNRLPKEDETVLCIEGLSGNFYLGRLWNEFDDIRWVDLEGFTIFDVDLWMPIPEPYPYKGE